MNAIDNMLRNIYMTIPKEVLEIGFLNHDDVTNIYTSLDEKIKDKVINRVIKNDLNLLGGTYTVVDLRMCDVRLVPQTQGMYYRDFIIRVPKHLTGDRSIIEVHKLASTYWNREDVNIYGGYGSNTGLQLGTRMLGNVDQSSVIQTSRLEIIGENVVLCRDPGYPLLSTRLHVSIENHPNFSNIQRHIYGYLADLAVTATKMYIWTNRVVGLNMGRVYGGHELSVVKEIIDEYKEAANEYQEKLAKWSVMSMANSKEKMQGYLNILIGNNI